MQYPLKKEPDSSPEPRLAPELAAPAAAEPARSKRKWVVFAAIIVLVGGALYVLRGHITGQRPPSQTAVQIRVAPAVKGALVRTLRLTGTTEAEMFASLRAPTMRGRRNFNGGSSFGSQRIRLPGSGTTLTIRSNAGGSSTFRATSNRFDTTSSGFGNSALSSSTGASSDTSSSSTGSSSSAAGGTSSSAGSARSPGGGVFVGGGGRGGGRSRGAFSQVLEELVEPGTHVKKGDVVAKFDTQYMETRLDDFRAAYEQDQNGFQRDMTLLETQRKAHELAIQEAKAALEKAKLDLRTVPVLSQIDAEKYRLAVDEAQAKYDQLVGEVKYVNTSADSQILDAKLDVQSSELGLKQAEMNLDKMTMRAPIDGITVMEMNFRGAEFTAIANGDELFPGQPFMKVVDPSSMRVAAYVNQVDAQQLRIGMKAKVHLDAYPSLELPATLTSIGAIAVSSQRRTAIVRQVPVYFRIDKQDPRVIPDLSVSADVLIDTQPNAITVPRESVFEDPGGQTRFVFVRNRGRFEKREVETGKWNYLRMTITNGLQPGEVVALDAPPAAAKSPARQASIN